MSVSSVSFFLGGEGYALLANDNSPAYSNLARSLGSSRLLRSPGAPGHLRSGRRRRPRRDWSVGAAAAGRDARRYRLWPAAGATHAAGPTHGRGTPPPPPRSLGALSAFSRHRRPAEQESVDATPTALSWWR